MIDFESEEKTQGRKPKMTVTQRILECNSHKQVGPRRFSGYSHFKGVEKKAYSLDETLKGIP